MEDLREDIFRAAKEGDEMAVIALLDADPGLLERENGFRDRPLIVAARHGQLGVVRLLAQRGANINATGLWGMTALHWAATRCHEEVVAFLLSIGAHVDARDGDRKTPLMCACMEGRLGVVQMLLQHRGGQGLDDTDIGGRTALHIAARNGHGAVVGFLLSRGAQQADIRDNREKTPFMNACHSGHLGVVHMLLQHTGGQGLDDADIGGKTALHWAAEMGQVEVVRFLLLAGADPTIRDNQGRTPRDIAEEEVPAFMFEDDEASLAEDYGARRAECVAVFKWWEGELERRYVLSKATCLHKAYTTQRDQPTSQVPTYLEARVAAWHAVPAVEVVLPQSEEHQEQEEEEEVHAVLEYAVTSLNEELLIELLEGFHGPRVEV